MQKIGRSSLSVRIQRDLIEADVEQGFGLVDLAEAATLSGEIPGSARILDEAIQIVADIEDRVSRLNLTERFPFLPLLTELRRGIEVARSHHSSTD